MSLYNFFMEPLEKKGIRQARAEMIQRAFGVVLEIGSGTGANIAHYNMDNITRLVLSDQRISKTLSKVNLDKVLVEKLNVEKLPYEDATFDYVVHTLVFCSVSNVENGLSEILRVLKPNGRIVFIEHIHPETKSLKTIFSLLNPIWKRVASGCNLTRDYETSLKKAGYEIIESSKFMSTIFVCGEAKPKNK